jgi:hypothetical protein
MLHNAINCCSRGEGCNEHPAERILRSVLVIWRETGSVILNPQTPACPFRAKANGDFTALASSKGVFRGSGDELIG